MSDSEQRAKGAKARNKRAYLASKPRQDHVLLRLPKGGAATLDSACLVAGLSRSAFAALYLRPMLEAIAPHLPAVDVACRERGQSLGQFLIMAIDLALANCSRELAPSPAATEFDKLFASGEG